MVWVCVFGNISGVAICKKYYGIVPTLFGWVLGMPFLHILSFVSFFFRIVSVLFVFGGGGGGVWMVVITQLQLKVYL